MVTAYPVKGKQKSIDICRAFIEGCGGALAHDQPDRLHPGAAFFYGVDASNVHLWDLVLREGREFYYCDNSYFDQTRQTYFRVTRNRLQHSGEGTSDGKRFAELGIPIYPANVNQLRGHVVVCPQSDWFMDRIVRYGPTGEWLRYALANIKSEPVFDQCEVRVRSWSPDKAKLSRSLPEDLIGALLLYTHSSAAAVTALLAGVPVVCSPTCAAYPLSSRYDSHDNFNVFYPSIESRTELMDVLADNQWTLNEMRSGIAWGVLHG